MSITRSTRLAAATAVAALASAGVAAAADAPVISAQHTVSGKAPVSVPGTGIKRGQTLPSGARIIYRDVTLTPGQKPTLTLTAPAGKTLRGLATRERDKVGFVLVRPRSYVGRRAATIRAFAAPHTAGRVSGRMYGLVR